MLAPRGAVTVVDIDRGSLQSCRAAGARHLVLGDATELPLGEGCFDLVSALDVLEHLPDDAAALRGIHHALKPGGSLLLSVPALRWLWGRQDVTAHHLRRYHRRELRDLLAAAGFETLRLSYFNSLLLPPIAAVRLAMRPFLGQSSAPRPLGSVGADPVRTRPRPLPPVRQRGRLAAAPESATRGVPPGAGAARRRSSAVVMNPAPHDDTPARPRRLFLLAALLLHLAFAGASALYTPAFEGPDENDHVYYAYQLHRTGQLPLITGTAAELGRPAYDEATLGHHPPLYYALAGLLLGDTLPSWRVNPEFSEAPAAHDDADATDPTPTSTLHKLHGFDERAPVAPEIHRLWAMRGFSVLCGLISITLVWLLGRRLFPERPSIAGAAAVLLACTPQWVWVHGCVENGNLATTLSLGALLALTDAVCRHQLGWQRGLGIGLLVGLALLTKLTSVFLLPLCGLVWGLGLLAWPERRRTLVSGLVALLVITAVAGWFFWRNQQLYGDPLALAAHQQAFASNRLETVATATDRPLDEVRFEYLTEDFPLRTAQSAVAGFGWQTVRAPIAEWLALLVVAAGLLGWLVRPHRLLRGRAIAGDAAGRRRAAGDRRAGAIQRHLRPAAGPLPAAGLRSGRDPARRRPRRAARRRRAFATPAALARRGTAAAGRRRALVHRPPGPRHDPGADRRPPLRGPQRRHGSGARATDHRAPRTC